LQDKNRVTEGTTLADANITGSENALQAVTKIYNYINAASDDTTTSISEEELLHKVTHGECDGVLDLVEFENALREAGLDLERYPEMKDRLGCARARHSSR
jgi:hypothetical protein